MQFGELFDANGKLAMSCGHSMSWDKPETTHTYYRSDISTTERSNLIGKIVNMFTGRYTRGTVHTDFGQQLVVDCTDWVCHSDATPIAKPKNGKEYGWRWGSGQWQKEYFPMCSECRHYHDPELPYCDDCGHCHKGKCKH